MKKLSIYITVLLAAALTACNEDFNEGVASPQSYGQEEAAGKITFTATGVDPINLGNVEEESVAVAVFTAPAVEEEATLSYKMKLDNKVTLAVDDKGHVATEDLQNAVAQIYGIRPVERTMNAVLTAYVAIGKTVYAAPAESYELKVTPEAPVIEGAYYLTGSLTFDKAVAFSNKSGDVYANPIFTVTVPALTNSDGVVQASEFTIQSVSGRKYGTLQAEALEGNLVQKDDANAIQIPAGDDYRSVKITIDMMNGIYKVEKLSYANFLWVPVSSSWSPYNSATLSGVDAKLQFGMVSIEKEFKLTASSSWNGGDYGYSYFITRNGVLPVDGNDNMQVSESGIYFLKVNLYDNKKEISAVKINSIGLIGDATVGGWDEKAETDMPYDDTEKCWSTTTTLSANHFKIRINKDWDTAIGGSMDALNADGGADNIALDTPGEYTVKLYLNGRLILIKNNN